MRGGALPAALLCLTFGLMLAFAPRRALLPALAALAGGSVLGLPLAAIMSTEIAFAGCWGSVVLFASTVHWRRGLAFWFAVAMGLDAGVWTGSVIAWEGKATDLLLVLPFALVAGPAIWAAERGWSIGIKVVSSWLIAVALLAATLPAAVHTPGYVRDHMG